MDVTLYFLSVSPLEKVLPQLLEKAYTNGQKSVVRVATENYKEYLNALLWTYSPLSFLPHGVAKDGHPDQHPIWLTTFDENPNQASLLVLAEGGKAADIKFDRILDLCEPGDATLQNRLDQYKVWDAVVTKWFQNNKGRWQKMVEEQKL